MNASVVGIGNALVDVVVHTEQGFPGSHGFVHGTATMVDEETADTLYGRVGPATEVSGGSAANTMVGIASFGGSAAYIGRVRDDQLGRVFVHDLRASGVEFDVAPAADGAGSGRCIVMVTPDAERTMCTFLGASAQLDRDDVDDDAIAAAEILYLEGYLWDQPAAKDAMRHAAEVAKAAGTRVALTLSDPFCVDRHRDEFHTLVTNEVDILFANEIEVLSLFETEDFTLALDAVRARCEIAALTRSAAGSVVIGDGQVVEVPAQPVDRVTDTTGAGDQYAAGFLHGIVSGSEPAEWGRLGAIAAAEVISHLGARPETPFAELAAR